MKKPNTRPPVGHTNEHAALVSFIQKGGLHKDVMAPPLAGHAEFDAIWDKLTAPAVSKDTMRERHGFPPENSKGGE